MQNRDRLIRLSLALIFFLWSTSLLAFFYITQRPLAFQVAHGLGNVVWTFLLTGLLLIDSANLGGWMMDKLQVDAAPLSRLILGTGLGLGFLGLAGYGLAALGWARPWALGAVLTAILIMSGVNGNLAQLPSELTTLRHAWRESKREVPPWIPAAALLTAGLGLLFALLPPAEGFDGLLYHLTLPAHLLADGGIKLYNVPQFWFPDVMEGDFIWALGLWSEHTTQLLHLAYSFLTMLLAWDWLRSLQEKRAAWWTLAVLVSMPSLVWLSSWAYSDMALAFFSLACLRSAWHWRQAENSRWLYLSGIFAGLAMGIKYTSFILPLTVSILIIAWESGTMRRVLVGLARFDLTALTVALPWYIRNWIWMGNPFYPFVFGGRYWDAFRAAWYAGPGSGIGGNIAELLLLPLNVTLGYHDRNYFDGRMGPLFLVLFPLAAWVLWRSRSASPARRSALWVVFLFSGLTALSWTAGVIQTNHLWQSRLLWPGLFPFSLLIGIGLAELYKLNHPKLRISFLASAIVGLVLFATLIDNGLSLVVRQPLAYALGIEPRQKYFQRFQSGYAEALDLVAQTPPGSHIYFLFEPRSYDMPRDVQPDPINDNLMHDFYLYGTSAKVLAAWRTQGYTHVLLFYPALAPALKTQNAYYRQPAESLLNSLQLIRESATHYRLYSIPPEQH